LKKKDPPHGGFFFFSNLLCFLYTVYMNPWGSRRRTYILAGIGAVLFVVLASTLIATLYKAPSCLDNTQNQGETGIDCGGPCSHLCTVTEVAPSVRFVRQVSPVPGRTDVIAYIDNSNVDAAVRGATFTINLYGPDNVLVASKQGTTDIPPRSAIPVYIPNFYSGNQTVSNAFLNFDEPSLFWYQYKDDRVLPTLVNYDTSNLTTSPQVTAVMKNSSARPLLDVKLVATVFAADGNAIAASQTVLHSIPAQGTAQAVFTWNTPFSAPPARIEVVSFIPLPPL
jgi:hypothetical protein